MNLNDLRYALAVAQERNFRRAAQRCFVTQPALSLAIQKLEDELGVRIFERSRAAVSLTPTGALIVEQAQRVLEEAAKVHEIARQGRDQLAGPLKLGVIYTVAPYLLPELIPILQRKAPRMPLQVEENLTAQLDLLLRNGRIDAAVIALPFDAPNVAVLPLYDEPFAVAVPANHAWAKRAYIRAEELANEKVLLLASGHCFSNQVAAACPELQRRGGEVLQGNSLETIRNMVASGLGITVLPASADSPRFRSPLLKVVAFKSPPPSRRIGLAWRKSFAREKAIEVLAEAIRAAKVPGVTPLAGEA
ncbi:MAG: LysR family transcriptional regulator [Burkholderiales bacterium]|nr:LysR family transcriptional regulator [Burkholderiales bacterium]